MDKDQVWLDRTLRLLQEALPAARVDHRKEAPSAPGRPDRPDLELRLGNGHLLVEIKTASASRVTEVLGQLARSVLELQRGRHSKGDVVVAIVGLERFGSRLEDEVRAFFTANASDTGWGLLDSRGHAVLEIPALEVRWRRDARAEQDGAPSSDRIERQLFTDLNRWMLKILILRNAQKDQWSGPRVHPRHPTDLARVAGVSIEKAHRLALSLEKEGYLSRAKDGLRLLRLRSLLEDWLRQERSESSRTVDVRPLRPASRGEEPPLPTSAREWAALGGAAAAKRRGLLHSSAPYVPLVHVKIPVEQALDRWNLVVVEPRDAVLRLRPPRYPESVFRGVVPRGDRLPLVDLWQMALDAVVGESRGSEQADFILERVLGLQRDA